jgi:hypothetical protein
MKKVFGNIVPGLVVVLAGILLLAGGCSAKQGEGFAIYLTRDDIPPARMEALSHVDIAGEPIISSEDIVTYNAQTHEMKLTPGAFKRISQLAIPTTGKSFLVCVDKAPLYWGAFWTPVSSQSFDGITIWQPLTPREPYVVTLELGYPTSSFYGGEDPRNNPAVMKALEQAGKLINKLSMATVEKLPASMKGYELYSWSQDSQWHFTLITGTNRNKTLEEITTGDDYISEDGWVKVQVVGVEAAKSVLGKLPRGEFVIWSGGNGLTPTAQAGVNIAFPPGATVDAIKEYAKERGLDFSVTGHQ